jgi:hypothetical protein
MTKSEKEENSRIVALGCIVCRRMGIYTPAQIHHVRKLATSKNATMHRRFRSVFNTTCQVFMELLYMQERNDLSRISAQSLKWWKKQNGY